MKSQRNTDRRRTILIPLDGSAMSERALRHLHLARWHSTGDVVLLRIVGPGHPGIPMRGDDAVAYRSMIDDREQARRYLESMKRKLARGIYGVGCS